MARVRERFRLTNMHMERRLREIRSSLPAMNARPHAETMSYTGTLGRLWKEHVDVVGGSNPLVENRESMKREGLPLVHLRRDRVRAKRKDVSRRNAEKHSRCAQEGPAGGPGKAASGPRPRPPGREMPESKSLEALPEQPDPVTLFPPFYSGCGGWPVSAENVLKANGGKETGLAGRGEKLRWRRRGCIVCAGNRDVVPHARQFKLRYSCVEMHPGLCFELDSAVYKDAGENRIALRPFDNADD